MKIDRDWKIGQKVGNGIFTIQKLARNHQWGQQVHLRSHSFNFALRHAITQMLNDFINFVTRGIIDSKLLTFLLLRILCAPILLRNDTVGCVIELQIVVHVDRQMIHELWVNERLPKRSR